MSVCPVIQAVERLGGSEAVDHLDHECGCYWYAYVHGSTLYTHRLHLIRKTPKGAWVQAEWDSVPYWRSDNRLARTRDAALWSLYRRKRCHVEHATRRFKDARTALQVVQGEIEKAFEKRQVVDLF